MTKLLHMRNYMENFKLSQCPTCGGTRLIKKSDQYICMHCGNIYFNEHADKEYYSLLDMALAQRQTAKFDEAFEIYNMLVNKFHDKDLSDVYFGMFLCEFSVIFENNMQEQPFPSFYAMRKTSCYTNYYYKKAIEQATANKNEEKLKTFEELVENIEYARKTYIAIEKSNRPYDIFICYKKTDNEGNLTPEFEKAKHIYTTLKNLGFKVFFADETINKQAVREWEPHIYYALYTSKAMLVMCSDNDYLNSAWVKNEWKRFISIKTNNENRAPIIPIVSDNFKASELPNALARYQALQYDNDIDTNIKEALLSLTKKVNDQKEFLFTYRKPLNKKLITAIVSIASAIIISISGILAYFNIPRLKYELNVNEYSIVGLFGKIQEINIPSYHKNLPVTQIGNSAFENNTSAISVNIGNQIKKIGSRSFSGMTSLKEVKMSDSVQSMGNYAFYGCNSLITITLSSGLTSISTGALASCEELFSITIPKNIYTIDVAAFYDCNKLAIINYTGTKSEWENVYKGINNGNLLNAYVVCNYEYPVEDEDGDNDGDGSETPPTQQLIFIAPTINYTIGRYFSDTELQYNSTLKQWEVHKAVDYLTATQQPVYAIQDGIVNEVYHNYLEGYVFSITHAQGFVSFYKSVDQVLVSEGQRVVRGQELAKTGTNANEQSDGYHVHLELMHNGYQVDPLEYINTTK